MTHVFDGLINLVDLVQIDLVQIDDARWQAALAQLDLDAGGYDPDVPNRLLADILTERGIPVLDLTEPLRQGLAGGDKLYFPIDGHWTPAGHQLAAERLAEFLTREVLSPDADT